MTAVISAYTPTWLSILLKKSSFFFASRLVERRQIDRQIFWPAKLFASHISTSLFLFLSPFEFEYR